MQGAGFTVIDHSAKVAAYCRKLILWKSYVTRDGYDVFPEITKYICGKEVDIKQTIIGHLEHLAQKIVHYYGDALSSIVGNGWIIDPFAGTDLPQLPFLVGEELVEIGRINRSYFFGALQRKTPKKF